MGSSRLCARVREHGDYDDAEVEEKKRDYSYDEDEEEDEDDEDDYDVSRRGVGVAPPPPTPVPVFRRRGPRRRTKSEKQRASLASARASPVSKPPPGLQGGGEQSLQASRQQKSLFAGLSQQLTSLASLGLPQMGALEQWRSGIADEHEEQQQRSADNATTFGRRARARKIEETAWGRTKETEKRSNAGQPRRCGACGEAPVQVESS
jgi:hypothetical protein